MSWRFRVRWFLRRWLLGRRYGGMPDGRFGYRRWWLAGWEPLVSLPSLAEIDAAMRVVFAAPDLERETPLMRLWPSSATAALLRIQAEERPRRVMDEAMDEDRRRDAEIARRTGPP